MSKDMVAHTLSLKSISQWPGCCWRVIMWLQLDNWDDGLNWLYRHCSKEAALTWFVLHYQSDHCILLKPWGSRKQKAKPEKPLTQFPFTDCGLSWREWAGEVHGQPALRQSFIRPAQGELRRIQVQQSALSFLRHHKMKSHAHFPPPCGRSE